MNAYLPNVTSYGEYSSDSYGVNSLEVDLGEIVIFYSYKTIVAYRDMKDGLVCCKNQWGTTTGKHLNWIEPDKKERLDKPEFDSMLENAIARHIK